MVESSSTTYDTVYHLHMLARSAIEGKPEPETGGATNFLGAGSVASMPELALCIFSGDGLVAHPSEVVQTVRGL